MDYLIVYSQHSVDEQWNAKYDDFLSRLKKSGAKPVYEKSNKRIHSVVVRTQARAADLRNQYAQYFDTDDELIVAQITQMACIPAGVPGR